MITSTLQFAGCAAGRASGPVRCGLNEGGIVLRITLWRLLLVLPVVGLLVLAASASALASTSTSTDSYSGRAYAVGITNATGLLGSLSNTFICDTGQLPAAGGSLSGMPCAAIPAVDVTSSSSSCLNTDVVCLDVLKETAAGASGSAASASHTAFVRVLPDRFSCDGSCQDLVNAQVVTADTSVTCDSTGHSQKSATTAVTSLSIEGITVAIPTTPNTVVTVPSSGTPIATITFRHEDTSGLNDAVGDALIIDFPATGLLSDVLTGTITIAHAESDATCGPAVQKTANGASSANVTAGANVTYGVTVTNNNQTSCTVTSVTDYLPPQPGQAGVPFTFVSGGPAGAARAETTGSNGQKIEAWTGSALGTLGSGQSLSFSFVAHVPSTEPGGTYTNSVTAALSCGPNGDQVQSTVNVTSTAGSGLAPVSVTAIQGINTAAAQKPLPLVPLGITALGVLLLAGAGWSGRRLYRR